MVADPDEQAVLRQRLGSEVRRLRKAAGLRQEDLADQAGYARSYIATVETGRDRPGRDFITRLTRVLNADAGLFSLYEELVASCTKRTADTHAPESSNDVNRRDVLRGLGAVALGAAAPAVPLSQLWPSAPPLDHFRRVREVLIDSDNMFGSKQVLPTAYAQIELLQRLRRGAQGSDKQAVLAVQVQFAEFAAWLHQDQSEYELARSCTDRALEWAHMARDAELTTIVLARKSQLAGDMQDAMTAIEVGEAAAHMAPSDTRLAAVATTYAAHGHALAGDADASSRQYARAHELVAATAVDPESSWGVWLDDAYIEAQRARSLVVLGQYDSAAEGFEQAMADLPSGYPRDRGVYLARAALAYAGTKDADRASQLGMEALAIAVDTQSGRISDALRRLDQILVPQGGVEARAFHDAMRNANAA